MTPEARDSMIRRLLNVCFPKSREGNGAYASWRDVSDADVLPLFSEAPGGTFILEGFRYKMLSRGAIGRYWVGSAASKEDKQGQE